jgi:hypothetical protein
MENPKVQNCFEEFSLMLNVNDLVFQKSKDLVLRKSKDFVLRKSKDFVFQKSKDLVFQNVPIGYPGVYKCIHGYIGVYIHRIDNNP